MAPPEVDGPGSDVRLGPGRSITVAEGEHFWALAEAVVTGTDAEADTAAVTAYWITLVDANSDILVEPGNADLLLVGQTVHLPPLTT